MLVSPTTIRNSDPPADFVRDHSRFAPPEYIRLLWNSGWGETPNKKGVGTELPKVRVGILSFNRCNDLRLTLAMVTTYLDYPNLEILVVDNGSSDGSVDMVREHFPEVHIVALKTNQVTVARNLFFAETDAEYVLCLDDDSCPAHPSGLSRLVEFMEHHRRVGAVSTAVLIPSTGHWQTFTHHQVGIGHDAGAWYEGPYLFECAALLRTRAIREAGCFDATNFWGAEGFDLALRLISRGWIAAWTPAETTYHFKQMSGRNRALNEVWRARHMLLCIAKNYPLALVPLVLLLFGIRRASECLMHPSRIGPIARGAVQAMKAWPLFARYRPKLRIKDAMRLYRHFYCFLRW